MGQAQHSTGYTDPKTIVVKFRRGLDRRISNALAGMTSGRPSDTDPEAWYVLAVQMDQNRAADEAFYAPQRSAPPALTSHRPGLLSAPKPSSAVRPTYFAHTTPTPGNPVSMDIDAAAGERLHPTPVADAEPSTIGQRTALIGSTSGTWTPTSPRPFWRISSPLRTSSRRSRLSRKRIRSSPRRILCQAAGEPCAPVAL